MYFAHMVWLVLRWVVGSYLARKGFVLTVPAVDLTKIIKDVYSYL